MNKTEKERIAVIETKMDVLTKSLSDLHKKIDGLDDKFAGKWVETETKEQQKSIDKLKLDFKGWTSAATVIIIIVNFIVQYILSKGGV